MFISSKFSVSGLIPRSLIHSELIFVQRKRDIVEFSMWISSFPSIIS